MFLETQSFRFLHTKYRVEALYCWKHSRPDSTTQNVGSKRRGSKNAIVSIPIHKISVRSAVFLETQSLRFQFTNYGFEAPGF